MAQDLFTKGYDTFKEIKEEYIRRRNKKYGINQKRAILPKKTKPLIKVDYGIEDQTVIRRNTRY